MCLSSTSLSAHFSLLSRGIAGLTTSIPTLVALPDTYFRALGRNIFATIFWPPRLLIARLMRRIGTAHRIRTVFVINMTRKTVKGISTLNWHERLQARKRSREHKRVHRRRRRGTACIFSASSSFSMYLPPPPSPSLRPPAIIARSGDIYACSANVIAFLTSWRCVFSLLQRNLTLVTRKVLRREDGARTFRRSASEFHPQIGDRQHE